MNVLSRDRDKMGAPDRELMEGGVENLCGKFLECLIVAMTRQIHVKTCTPRLCMPKTRAGQTSWNIYGTRLATNFESNV